MNWFEDNIASASDDDEGVDESTDVPLLIVQEAKRPRTSTTNVLEVTATPQNNIIGIDANLATTYLCASISAKDLPFHGGKQIRSPVDIVVALDVSAFMGGGKLELCRVGLELLVRSLLPGDRFGLVTFSSYADVEIPIQTIASEEQKEELIGRIKSVDGETSSTTRISDAIRSAAQQLRSVSSPNGVRAIFLLTDGFSKIYDDLVNLTKSCCGDVEFTANTESRDMPPEENEAPPRSSITIHCFGYGSNHDSKILQNLALAKPGSSYYFIEKDTDLIPAFGDALGGILSVVVQNVVVTVTVPPESRDLGVDIVNVRRSNAFQEKDGSYVVLIGDLYAQERKDVLFEVKLANPSNYWWITHATVSLSYTDTLSREYVLSEPVLCDIARITEGRPSFISDSAPHVKVQHLRVRAIKAIRDAVAFARKGNFREACVKIENMLLTIERQVEEIRLDPLSEQIHSDLKRCLDGLESDDAYITHGSRTLRNLIQSHDTQRCMDSFGAVRPNVYRGDHKARTIAKFQAMRSLERVVHTVEKYGKTYCCCICMSEPEPQELAMSNGCEHFFCFECIEKWADRENTCPLCKKRFSKIDRVQKPLLGNDRM